MQGGPKVGFPKRNEYVQYGPSKQADFFINNRDMSKVYIHKESLSEALYLVSLLISTKKIHFFTDRKKPIYDKERPVYQDKM